MSKDNDQNALTVKEKMFEDMKDNGQISPEQLEKAQTALKERMGLVEGEAPAYLDSPVTVKTLTELEEKRRRFAELDALIAQAKLESGIKGWEDEQEKIKSRMKILGAEFLEQTDQKSIRFLCGPFTWVPPGESPAFDKDVVLEVLTDLTGCLGKLDEAVAPKQDAKPSEIVTAAPDLEAIQDILQKNLTGSDLALVGSFISNLQAERDLAVTKLDGIQVNAGNLVERAQNAVARLADSKKMNKTGNYVRLSS